MADNYCNGLLKLPCMVAKKKLWLTLLRAGNIKRACFPLSNAESACFHHSFLGSKTDVLRGKRIVHEGKNIGGYIKKEALVLAPHQILAKHLECVHTWLLTILVAFNCEHGLWWLFLPAGISIEGECCESFERFTMSVTPVVNCGENVWQLWLCQ